MASPTVREMLENLEIAINTKLARGAVQSYSIAGRNIQNEPLSELFKIREKLRQEVRAGRGSTTYVRFDNPS